MNTGTADQRPVFDTTASPHARLSPLSPAAVRLSDAFWEPRMRTNREKTLFGQYDHMESTGRMDNFRRASGRRSDLDFQGIYFNDSDVYKWLEAAAWSQGSHPDPALENVLATAIEEIAAAQQPDGYLNTYFMFDRAGERWSDLKEMHEMYLAGHFMQAAVARRRATGDDDLLRVAVRLADHILSVFGPGKRAGACGHQEIEMAMVELYRETRDTRYLRAAEFFVDVRGRTPGILGGGVYLQDHKPFAELTENVGHAVRMLYMNAGVADIVLETGDAVLRAALDRLWDDFTQRKMYITGGAGARWDGEAFGAPYELPDRAYAETCAGIAAVMWAARMNALTAEARYIDTLERALYNNVLAGLSLEGDRYFYQNPLADRGEHRRKEWFGCACCPPNLARLLAELPGYVYAASTDAIFVNLYAQGEAEASVGGARVALATRTDYPWDGAVEIRVSPEQPTEFTLNLRIPEWCDGASLAVNGEPVASLEPGRYAEIRRTWSAGDTVGLYLPMPVQAWQAHSHVRSQAGRVAFTRGPLVYCLEGVDNPGVDVWDVRLNPDTEWRVERRPDLLGGVVTLKAEAHVADSSNGGAALYCPADAPPPPERAATVTAIPYYAWANRDPGPMAVWV